MKTRLVSSVEIPFLLKREKFMINFGFVGFDGFRNAKFFFFFEKTPLESKTQMATYAACRYLASARRRLSSLEFPWGGLSCCNPYVLLCMCTCELQVGGFRLM